ncbi:hypothetical protein A4S05_37775 [Nostoc sp. KVJ20]|uniref:hypothetical protein n=1 Tax=unclassified Nostoc TaxID=2593658 RepID=UPI00083D2FE5|nr:hypothetical protein [Nostoc sp. KVJ20]ODG99434.1 hypothetical protein A4S05_37775 [Nostoc sp. KVJ20]
MGNTIIFLGKSGERRGAMLEFENVEMKNLLNWWQMRRSGLSGWGDFSAQIAIAKRSIPPKQKELTLIQHPGIINYGETFSIFGALTKLGSIFFDTTLQSIPPNIRWGGSKPFELFLEKSQ